MEFGSVSYGSVEYGGIIGNSLNPLSFGGALQATITKIAMPQATVSNIASGNIFSQSQGVPSNLGL